MTEDEKTDNVALQRRPFSSGRGQGRPQERESRVGFKVYFYLEPYI